MEKEESGSAHDRWARLRFSVVGHLLAAPPAHGELQPAIEALSRKTWRHPTSGALVTFGISTIERWYYAARREIKDPVSVLRRRPRGDLGKHKIMSAPLRAALRSQYASHKTWSCQLHKDNLAVLVKEDATLGEMPSYSTVRRFMKAQGLLKERRLTSRNSPGAFRARDRRETLEVRSYEAEFVNGLWHLDFHHGSRKVLTREGSWEIPLLLGVLDDCSRLACHLQWYLSETAEDLVHGFSQAIQKRGVPRAAMMDNGSAMVASETREGLLRLGIVQELTLPYSPNQNGKQETFWASVEGRLVAMLEGVADLTLEMLNEATQAWVELDYNHRIHSELGVSPLRRFLDGKDVGRPSPSSDALRSAFRAEATRMQRRGDGTISLLGRRFEVPSRFRHLDRIVVRYASWDLSEVDLVDERRGEVLCALYPLDKARNADGIRSRLEPPEGADGPVPVTAPPSGMAPLLRKLIADYAASGLPPAYLPKHEDRETTTP